MRKFGIILLAVIMVTAWGCGKKEEPAPAASKEVKAAEPAPATPQIEGWALAKAFEQDEKKAGTEYVGRTFIVKNLVIYAIYSEEKRFEGFAYDPESKTITTTGKLRLNGTEVKATETDFYYTVTLADAADLANLKEYTATETAGGRISDFAGPYAFEAKIEKVEGNNIYLIGAKAVKK
jgi:hypothetical protein